MAYKGDLPLEVISTTLAVVGKRMVSVIVKEINGNNRWCRHVTGSTTVAGGVVKCSIFV